MSNTYYMKSFLSKPELKEMLIEEIKKHRVADEIVQGTYANNGKYCAVGCSIESLNFRLGKKYGHSDHSVYETELGIPRIIAQLEDRIFEGLAKEASKDFPLEFIEAVPVGADLSLVWPKFAVWLLGDEKDGVLQYAKSERSKKVITDVVELYKRVIAGESKESLKKEFAAADADAAAAYAAAAAAAAYAYAAAAAAAAADADADAAADAAADAYAYAAAPADADADAAADAAAAADADAARRVHYGKCAAKLIEILKDS